VRNSYNRNVKTEEGTVRSTDGGMETKQLGWNDERRETLNFAILKATRETGV